MTRDERRRAAAGRMLSAHLERMTRDIAKVRSRAGSDGGPLCRGTFLRMAERHLELAAMHLQSACRPPEARQEDRQPSDREAAE